MRVMHVVPTLDGGGAERVLLTVLRGLPEMSHAVAIAGGAALLPLVPSTVRVRMAQSEVAVARLMAQWRPNVVHTWLDDSLRIAAAAAAHLGIDLVHRIYNVPSVQHLYYPRPEGHEAAIRSALRVASRIVALSATAADDAARFYGIRRPDVIHNGFPLAGERGDAHAPAPKAPGRFVILAVGRLASEKGHDTLIEAVGRIARRHAHVDLWLAGIGPREPQLRRQAAQAGITDRAHFLGFREDVASLLAAADLFVFPSLTEGFGNAFGEALVAGKAIIASDLPVIREELLAGTNAAWLYPPGEVAALASALDRLVSDADARETLAAAARCAGERFGVQRMLAAYRALYAGFGDHARVAA
jgi:glycosyltransferase involved in cell wall biosynthesis